MKTIWKIYSIVYLLVAALLLIGVFTDSKSKTLDYVDAIISVPTILAVWGWAWKKKIGTQRIWLVYTVLFLGFDIVYNFFLDSHKATLTELVVALVLLLPAYLATILYAINFDALKRRGQALNTNAGPVVATQVTALPFSNTRPQAATWNMHEQQPGDIQLSEIQQQQAISFAQQGMAQSMAQEVQATQDAKIEAEQLGKWPWERWYSHPVVGRSAEKGIADLIFLTFFGSSSATDRTFTKSERALIRVLITLAVLVAFSYIGNYLTKA